MEKDDKGHGLEPGAVGIAGQSQSSLKNREMPPDFLRHDQIDQF
jgi:hypothetical protein